MFNKTVKPDLEKYPIIKQHKTLLPAVLLLIVMSVFTGTVHAELPVVAGEQWMASDSDSKLAFLLGMATMAKVEQNLIGDPPPPGTVSYAPALAKGLAGMTLTDVMNRLDALYSQHPERMQDAVITLIWEEIAIPSLKAQEKGEN
jgi:hypothetical protein